MAESAGWATLDVIPSVKGLASELEKQTSSGLASAGKKSGAKFGDAAGKEAGGKFKSRFQSGVKDLMAPLAGLAAGAGIAKLFGDALGEAKEAARVARTTAQLVETTGQAANLTADQVANLAGRMMEYAAIDDDVIQAGANVLLTFRNIRNEAGANNDIFDRTVKAGLDLAAVLGTDLSSSAVQLGKALNDPIKGVTALGRAGVQFTADQKAQIKALVDAGDLLSAQKLVLDELEGQVGGAAGAAADGTERLAVAFGNLKEAAGLQLLPAVEAFSNWAVEDGLPALEATGGAAVDAAKAFAGLPGPVKAAAGAFVALRLASSTGLTAGIVTGAGKAKDALDSLRLQAMFTADAYRDARTVTRQFGDSSTRVSSGVGRLSASMSALRVGAAGAGGAMRGALSGALGLLGGPWGAALIGGTALVTHFWSEHQKAKQFVDDLTTSLDAQTGALTENSSEIIRNQLASKGWLEYADDLGISLDKVRAAAEGDTKALAEIEEIVDRANGSSLNPFNSDVWTKDSGQFIDALRSSADAIDQAKEQQDQFNRFNRDGADASAASADAMQELVSSMDLYKGAIADARSELKSLLSVERARARDAIQSRRDAIALREQYAAAREEAAKGKRTLNENTAAGRENMSALLDLADQWTQSTPKVQNAEGAYENMRRKFIAVAEQMGATREKARKLADELLSVPKTAPLEFQSKGYKKMLAEIAAIKAAAADLGSASLDFTPRGFGRADGGGKLTNTTPTPSRTPDTNPRAGVNFNGPINVQAHDYDDFTRQLERKTQRASLGGRP